MVWYNIKMARSDEMFDFKCKFIEEIKLYPAIYDKAHPDHLRRNKKGAIFEAIGASLGVTGKFYILLLNETRDNNRKVCNKLVKNAQVALNINDMLINTPAAEECQKKWKDLVIHSTERKKVVQRGQQSKNVRHPGISMIACPSCVNTFSCEGYHM